MKHLKMIRMPWGSNEGQPVYYEFRVGKNYPGLGECIAIVEHTVGAERHYEILFPEKGVSYYDKIITEYDFDEN